MQKLIITVAPTGNVPTKEMTPHVPVTPEEIVRDIVECRQLGASVAHIHARDEAGKPTHEKRFFAEILRRLDDKGCSIIRQISTGARAGKTPEDRAEALTLNPDSASLATGSSNFPASANLNEPQLIEFLAKTMLARKIKPELEIFDSAMINNALELQKKGLIKEPLQFNLVLGVKGSLPATPKNLFFLVESLPPNSVWSVSVVGPMHVPLSMIAMALGGHVRVGVEDNIFYSKGKLATNTGLVERIASLAKAMGREIASPEETKQILGLS
ncbi:aldolase-type tim barrel [Lucifera butyrica]|uniref:Aldolase-type tim barrel n=1 Tax=Lucifera butyrica TaxID=1351585 RepID=A0A498R3F9_9FIRM|nr:3-keto-5-aminohexanoate cleavage protein [Lucifera butyrica]VBB05340.1 aldolase-type tim barrel [Lucifera butyrica]